jgi:hypothetical protein
MAVPTAPAPGEATKSPVGGNRPFAGLDGGRCRDRTCDTCRVKGKKKLVISRCSAYFVLSGDNLGTLNREHGNYNEKRQRQMAGEGPAVRDATAFEGVSATH